MYALARRFGLDDEAHAAALHACRAPPQAWPFCDELAHISAADYHALLVFHRRFADEALQLFQAYNRGGESCGGCGKLWAKKYRAKAARVLADTPTSERVFLVSLSPSLQRTWSARIVCCKRCERVTVEVEGCCRGYFSESDIRCVLT